MAAGGERQTGLSAAPGDSEAVSRRAFLLDGLRGGVLACLVGAGLFLSARRRDATAGQRCVNQGVCTGCPAYPDCGLPAALSRRQAGRVD